MLASALGIFAGVAGASHGLGEMLQGNTVPNGLIIEAWPRLTALSGEPAMTVIPSFLVTGIFATIFGVLVGVWGGACIERKHGGLVLILLSIIMLLVGGGLVPPFIGIAAGLMGVLINRETAKQEVAKQ